MPDRTAGDIVVGFDGSAPALAALDWATSEAELRHCALHVVHADFWSTNALEMPAFQDETRIENSILSLGVKRARALAADLVVLGRREAPPAGETLVRSSARAALLVVGSRHLKPMQRWAVGSVSTYCVEHAACPVVVVHEPVS